MAEQRIERTTHHGYSAIVAYEVSDGVFVARVAGLTRDGIAFRASVDFYLARCAAAGRPPERPAGDDVPAAG